MRAQIVVGAWIVIVGCGSPSAPTGASAPATPPAESAPAAAVVPGAAPSTPATDVVAPPAAIGGDVRHLGWAERERRTFVLQSAARGSVTGIGIARGGAHVAVGGSEGFVTVLDAATGETRASERIGRSSRTTFDIEMSGDVALVSWAGYSGQGVEVWRWRDGGRIDLAAVNADLADAISGAAAALAPRGDRIVLATTEGLHVLSARTGRITTTAPPQPTGELSWPHAAAIVDDRSEGLRRRITVYDPRTLGELWTALADMAAIVRPSGDRIVLLDGADVIVRALPSGEERTRIAHGLAGADHLVATREGDRVAISGAGASVVLAIDGSARTEVAGGPIVWLSARTAMIEVEDGAIRRWVFDRARLGQRLVPPIVIAEDESDPEPPANEVAIDPNGTIAFARGDRVEVIQSTGVRHEFAHGGEHSVWWVEPEPTGTALAVGGRFGVQTWRADGPHETSCVGSGATFVVDWAAGKLVSDGECDLTTGARARASEREPFAQSAGGRFVVRVDGSFFDRSSSRRVALEGQSDLYCEEDECVGRGWIAPGGVSVVIERYEAEDGPQVHETTGGRLIATLPLYVAHTFAADGSALAYAGNRSLHWVDLAGEAHATRRLAGSAHADDDLSSQSETVLAASPDGRAIAWAGGNRHRAQVLATADGAQLAEISPGATVIELRWSRDGRHLAIQTLRGIVIHDLTTHTDVVTLGHRRGTLTVACADSVLRVIRDAAAGGFEVIDLGACGAAETLPTFDGRHLIWRDEGIARVRRLEGGAELVVRTVRDAGAPRHLAHDAEGHWWTDEAPTEAAPVPTWIRHGDGRGGETQPFDPAMRRDDLLRTFFAPPP